uniref:Nuf2 protein n=1 Tax=Fopius arisanus TaxID=64838 RepID=A0A0C9QLY1_9HYME
MDNQDTIEAMQTLLEQVELPSSAELIRNPTEEFIIDVISAFFDNCHIDTATIKRLTPSQRNALEVTNPENAYIASILNLREAAAVVGREIFMRDFQITDITSPRHIRAKKQLRFLGNFLLYANNKKSHMQERIDEVLSRAEKIQSLRAQKQDAMERMNEQALLRAQKKMEIKKIEQEIIEWESKISGNRAKIAIDDKILKERDAVKAQRVARNQGQRAELQKYQDIDDELNGKVVRSPEKFRTQLRDLTEARKNQEEKRDNIQGAILHKRTLLQTFETALNLIKKEQGKLGELIEDQKKLKGMKKEGERLKEEVDEAARTISLVENMESQEPQVIAGAIQETEKLCQERIQKIKKTFVEADGEKKLLERKKETLEIRCTELGSQTAKIREQIQEIEVETRDFLRHTQELHDSEMAKIQRLHGGAPNGMD